MKILKLHSKSTPGNLLHEDFTGIKSSHASLKLYAEQLDIICAIHGGVGIAANQLGMRENFFFVVKGSNFKYKAQSKPSAHFFINPTWEALPKTEMVEEIEGCLSLPGRRFYVKRPYRIVASWTNVVGHRISGAVLHGASARIFQHEHDHLRGVTLEQSSTKEI